MLVFGTGLVITSGSLFVLDAIATAPGRLLELWDFEACPYCRKVREVLSELDLDYRVHPVAQGSGRRAELVRSAPVASLQRRDAHTGTLSASSTCTTSPSGICKNRVPSALNDSTSAVHWNR